MTAETPPRYQLESEIGRGAMGEVYRAHDQVLHRTVVLKFLARDAGDKTSRI